MKLFFSHPLTRDYIFDRHEVILLYAPSPVCHSLRFGHATQSPKGEKLVMDPKNWTLPEGVEWRTRNEVQDVKEAQEL